MKKLSLCNNPISSAPVMRSASFYRYRDPRLIRVILAYH